MAPKLYKAADVCDMAQVQLYVLRSWEKEFPGIGVQKSADGPRMYRQSDVDQVLRIRQLVFGEGLTLAGARRRLEEAAPVAADEPGADLDEVLDAPSSDVRTRIASVRDGLRSILDVLSGAPGAAGAGDDFQLDPPPVKRSVANTRSASSRTAPRVIGTPARGAATKAKRSRVTA